MASAKIEKQIVLAENFSDFNGDEWVLPATSGKPYAELRKANRFHALCRFKSNQLVKYSIKLTFVVEKTSSNFGWATSNVTVHARVVGGQNGYTKNIQSQIAKMAPNVKTKISVTFDIDAAPNADPQLSCGLVNDFQEQPVGGLLIYSASFKDANIKIPK